MADPAIEIFEIVRDSQGRKNKAEWKVLQTVINKRVKANKGTDPKAIKQQVFDEVAAAVSNVIDGPALFSAIEDVLRDVLTAKFGEDAKAIAGEVTMNNSELRGVAKEFMVSSLGGLEHGLNDKQWEMIDKARRLLSECYKIGERIGTEKTKEAFKDAVKGLLATDWRVK